MSKLSKKFMTTEGLRRCGFKPIDCNSSKYEAFERGECRYFVGRSGALRAGKSPTTSRSLTDTVTQQSFMMVSTLSSSCTEEQFEAARLSFLRQKKSFSKITKENNNG